MFSRHVDLVEDDHEETKPERAVRRGAKAVISSGSRVLLLREQHSNGQAFWTLPGGGVRSRESPAEGLRRELLEELRCDSVVTDTVGTIWYSHHGSSTAVSRYTVFSCLVVHPTRPVRSEGILEARWVAPERLPARTIPQVRQLLTDRSSWARGGRSSVQAEGTPMDPRRR